MAIVEGKTGMQVGNMPSIDAVSQDGFIIYSDDGIHTYKMTIAEFAQAIGVVMTGGGDGDGGDGLLYWTEESRRIFRDLMSSNENDFRTIAHLLDSRAHFKVFRTVACPAWSFSNDGGVYVLNVGTPHVIPKYDTYNVYPNDVEKDILRTFRFPALDELLGMPDSRYYCNYTNPEDRALTPYSSVPSELTYEDIIINRDEYISGQTYKYDTVPPEEGPYETFRVPTINALGQDRRFFGYINVNVNRTAKLHNLEIPYTDGYEYGVVEANTQEELDLVWNNKKREAMLVTDDFPYTGTMEYIFTLYCLGCPTEKVKASYNKNNQLEEFEYYPWTLATKPTQMCDYVKYRVPYHFNDNSQMTPDLSSLEEPPEIGQGHMSIYDKISGNVTDMYERPLQIANAADRNNPHVETHYTYRDKTDVGSAYFTDDEGTLWYITLTPRTRADKSYWTYRCIGQADHMIYDDPSDFDKAPQFLDIGYTPDHWCYDGTDNLENDYDLWDGGWDGVAWYNQSTEKWNRKHGVYRYSLKSDLISLYNERIQAIGRSILNALGLRGIKPLLLESSGIHSEISATPDTALNGGNYLPGGVYEETYNLNAVTGSLYLKGDAYDNGEKLKDAYQKKLIAGENINITDDENGHPVISSTGGGGSGSVDIEAEYDSSNKILDITGFNGKEIQFVNTGGIHTEIANGHDGKSDNIVSLKPVLDLATNSTVGGVMGMGNVNRNKLVLDINSDYQASTQRRLTGSKHVYLSSGPEQDGNTPTINSGARDWITTDCIDTIYVNGVAKTTQHDVNTGSHYVDLTIPGAGVSPFTVAIGGNYGGTSRIETGFSSFTNIGSIYLQPNNNYCWIEVEVAMYVNSTDSIAADSVITMELRPNGFSGDICDPPGTVSNRSLQLTDSKHIIHSTDGPVWNKISVSGLVNYSGDEPLRLNVNVKQNSGISKYVKWKAGVAYVPVSS